MQIQTPKLAEIAETKTGQYKRSRLKESIFFICYQIIECKTLSQTMAIFFLTVQFLQMLAMTVNQQIQYLEVSYIGQTLAVSDYILVYPAILSNNMAMFNLSFSLFALFLQTFLIMGGFYICYNNNQDNIFIKDFKNNYAFVADAADKIFFIPICGICMANLSSR